VRVVLSWSGGGVRAMATLRWAQLIEHRIGVPLWRGLDMVAGTSTGGIVALALASGMSAGDVLELYRREAPRIFRSTAWQRVRSGWGLLGPRYPADGLVEALYQGLGTAPIADLDLPVMVTAHEMPGGELVDGGVHALQPIDSLLLEAAKRWPGEPVVAIAVGHEPRRDRERAVYLKSWDDRADVPAWVAGYATAAAPTYFPGITTAGSTETESGRWGAARWGMEFPTAALEGGEGSSMWRARQIVGFMPEGSALIDIRPLRATGRMDDASPANLRTLETIGIEMMEGLWHPSECAMAALESRAAARLAQE
jgi:predicted acylesterase/phospholipase RssA